jgi:hypothetical protein
LARSVIGAVVTGQNGGSVPPSGVIPVVVPDDVVLARAAGLVVWAGAVTVYPQGFAFTLLTLFDTRQPGPPPASWALDVAERGRMTWLEIGYSDGRRRAADLNANTPRRQPGGPHLHMLDGLASYRPEGWDISRWWATPLPPPGPVELAIHLNGETIPTGVGRLDGNALVSAAGGAEAVWLEPRTE